MKRAFLDRLRCPRCGGELRLGEIAAAEGEEIVEGALDCGEAHSFRIERGIPDLVVGLDAETGRTAEQFAYEFLDVGEVEDHDRKLHEDVTLFVAKTGIDERLYTVPELDFRVTQDHRTLEYEPDFSRLEGKVVVDAGAANGRYARIVADHCAELVLVDVGEHLYEARARLGHLEHVHFVRANLLHLPLAPDFADFIYTIGVVHHTERPADAIRRLAETLAPGGELAAWVYPPEYWGHPIKSAVTHGIRAHLLRKELPAQVRFIRRYLMPLGRLQLRLARRRWSKLLTAPLFLVNVPRHEDRSEMEATVIDYYLPAYIFTYTTEELIAMLEQCGLSARALPFPTSAVGRRPTA